MRRTLDDDLPELDSLLVVYPDEMEAFERSLSPVSSLPEASPAGTSEPASDISHLQPAPLTGMVVREWPPLDDAADFDAALAEDPPEFLPENPPAPTAGRAAPASADAAALPRLRQASAPDVPSSMRSNAVDEALPAEVGRATSRPAVLADQEEDAPTPDLSFVRAARRQAFWRSPLVRLGLAVLCLLLAGIFGLQWAVQERDRIAASSPSARPWLQAVCDRVGCSIAPQRHIELMVIDSSSFNKNRGDTYQLSLTLKNLSRAELATPAVEVTLTDAQDQALVRRVLLPVEMDLPVVIGGQSERSVTLPIAVSVGNGSARVAGYRLLAFYP